MVPSKRVVSFTFASADNLNQRQAYKLTQQTSRQDELKIHLVI